MSQDENRQQQRTRRGAASLAGVRGSPENRRLASEGGTDGGRDQHSHTRPLSPGKPLPSRRRNGAKVDARQEKPLPLVTKETSPRQPALPRLHRLDSAFPRADGSHLFCHALVK